MQNILVVDDEAIQRRVLAKMIREARPGCSVLEAKNGQDALDIIRAGGIDIVFTDIKMPVLDGLEMIESMNAFAQDMKVIILSGYRYFEYAQKAVQLGAFDYLVKPIKEESIRSILDKAESSIRKEQTNLLETEQIKRQLDRTLSAYYETLLTDWVTGGVAEAQRAEIRQQFSLGSKGVVVAVRLGSASSLMESLESEDRIKRAVLSRMEEQAAAIGPSVSFFSREDKRLLVTVLTAPQDEAIDTGILTKLMKELAEQPIGVDLTVGIGAERSDIFQDARHSCKEALTAASFRYFLHDRRVIQYPDISGLVHSLHYDYAREEEQLKESIRKNKSEHIARQSGEWFDRMMNGGLPDPEQWKKCVLRMMAAVAPVIKDFVTDQDYKDIVLETEASLSGSLHAAACRQRFLDTLLEWADLLQKSRSRKHESVVETCIQYIDAHFMDDLSLDTVAANLFFSPSYLSMMFKNHLGMTFSKYLSDVRIKKGIELLQNSDMKVYEIASQVGFKDDKYFYRVFKSRFGVTPDEYRRNKHLTHMSND